MVTAIKIILPFLVAMVLSELIVKIFSNKRLGARVHLVFFRSIVIMGIWFVGAFVALANIPGFEKSWETVLTGSGLVAVVVGLAAQTTLANIFAGISVTMSQKRPFNIGDRIQVGDRQPGYVRDITLRHVELETYLHQRIFIANSKIGEEDIINFSRENGSSYTVETYVAYGTDLKKAKAIMENIIYSHPDYYGVHVPVLTKELGESGILLRGTVTTASFEKLLPACSEVLDSIAEEFGKAGIEIPFNQLDVRMKKDLK